MLYNGAYFLTKDVMEQNLTCPSCKNIPAINQPPNYCSGCNKLICRECEGQMKLISSSESVISCPFCKKLFDRNILDNDSAELKQYSKEDWKIRFVSLTACCKNDKCDWSMRFDPDPDKGTQLEYAKHIKSCNFELELCKYCQENFLRKDICNHEAYECRNRFVTCENCSEQVVFENLKKHGEKECSRYQLVQIAKVEVKQDQIPKLAEKLSQLFLEKEKQIETLQKRLKKQENKIMEAETSLDKKIRIASSQSAKLTSAVHKLKADVAWDLSYGNSFQTDTVDLDAYNIEDKLKSGNEYRGVSESFTLNQSWENEQRIQQVVLLITPHNTSSIPVDFSYDVHVMVNYVNYTTSGIVPVNWNHHDSLQVVMLHADETHQRSLTATLKNSDALHHSSPRSKEKMAGTPHFSFLLAANRSINNLRGFIHTPDTNPRFRINLTNLDTLQGSTRFLRHQGNFLSEIAYQISPLTVIGGNTLRWIVPRHMLENLDTNNNDKDLYCTNSPFLFKADEEIWQLGFVIDQGIPCLYVKLKSEGYNHSLRTLTPRLFSSVEKDHAYLADTLRIDQMSGKEGFNTQVKNGYRTDVSIDTQTMQPYLSGENYIIDIAVNEYRMAKPYLKVVSQVDPVSFVGTNTSLYAKMVFLQQKLDEQRRELAAQAQAQAQTQAALEHQIDENTAFRLSSQYSDGRCAGTIAAVQGAENKFLWKNPGFAVRARYNVTSHNFHYNGAEYYLSLQNHGNDVSVYLHSTRGFFGSKLPIRRKLDRAEVGYYTTNRYHTGKLDFTTTTDRPFTNDPNWTLLRSKSGVKMRKVEADGFHKKKGLELLITLTRRPTTDNESSPLLPLPLNNGSQDEH